MKKFKVCLNQQPTKFDIIIHDLPLRNGLKLLQQMILDFRVDGYTISRAFVAGTGVEVNTCIDHLLKTCYNKMVRNNIIDASTETAVEYGLSMTEARTDISVQNIRMIGEVNIEASSDMQIDVEEPVDTFLSRSPGSMEVANEIVSELKKMMKYIIEHILPELELTASVDQINVQYFLDAGSETFITADSFDLFYLKDMTDKVLDFATEIDVDAIEMKFARVLGNCPNSMELSINVGDGDFATKHLNTENTLTISANAVESIEQFTAPGQNDLVIGVEMQETFKRRRKLCEMDDNPPASYDSMTLDDVDYITL